MHQPNRPHHARDGVDGTARLATGSQATTFTASTLVLLLTTTLVACTPAPPREPAGDLRITTTSQGHGIPDEFTLTIDGAPHAMVPSAGSEVFERMPVGVYTVGLTGLPTHCRVELGPIVVVEVMNRDEVEVAFAVDCVASELIVVTDVDGPPARATGWSVRLNEDEDEEQPIAPNGQTVFHVAPGEHNVRLRGMPANCATPGANPVIVEVPPMASTGVTIGVECEGDELTVSVTTRGDPNPATSFSVTAVTETQPIDPNGSVLFADVPVGNVSVLLGGLPSHCRVIGSNPRTATVPGSLEFEVDCGSICGEPPSSASLSASSGTTGDNGVVATVVIAAAYGAHEIDVQLEASGPDAWYYTNQYVQTLDWLCPEPSDASLAGEPVTARFVLTGEVSAAASGVSGSAEGTVFVNFGPISPVSHRADVDGGSPTQVAIDEEILVPLTLGGWTRLVTDVDVRTGTRASSRAIARMALAFDGVRDAGDATVPLTALVTASGVTLPAPTP